MGQLQAVVLDYGGVLCRHQRPDALTRIAELAGVPGDRLWPVYWAERPDYDRGLLDGPGFWARVAEVLGTEPPDPARAAALVEADTLSWTDLDPGMVAWVAALGRAGVRTALLSNAPPELRDHVLERFGWAAGFDVRTFSCDLGVVKPDPAIYRACVDELGVEPGAALFVDDRAPNVEGAVVAGLRGHVFTSAAGLAAALRGTGLPLPA
jgi:putative hydrolase of the HAD superfamily